MLAFHSTTTFVAFPPDAVVTIPELLLFERNWMELLSPAQFPAYTAEDSSVLPVQLEYDVPVIPVHDCVSLSAVVEVVLPPSSPSNTA